MSRSRLPGLLAIPVLAASLVVGATPVLARGSLDQSQTQHDVTFVKVIPPVWIGQTFTAGVSGKLDTVRLVTDFEDIEMAGVTVQILGTSDGLPTDTVLATSVIPAEASSDTWFDVIFDSPATVVAGSQYAIWVGPEYIVGLDGVRSDVYAGGNVVYSVGGPFLAYPDFDLAFQTFVTPPPYGFAWESPTKGKGDGVNKPRAGTTVPVTFSLDTKVKASKLLAPGWPKVRRVDCTTHRPKAGTEWMSRPFGATGLTREGTDYTYAWRVRLEWGSGALACRELRIKLTDGTTHSALYRFRPAP